MNEKSYIYPNRYKNGFPALLKMADGQLLESGQAVVSTENQSVDFTSDFVPLFTMGTPLEIAWVFNGEEIHSFFGEVYLSSKRLLRITSVHDTLLEGSEQLYLFSVEYAASVQPVIHDSLPSEKGGFFKRKKKPVPLLQDEYPVTITGIALECIEFSSPVPLPETTKFLLNAHSPVLLENVALEVHRVLEFGQTGQKYFCGISAMPKMIQRRWGEFIRRTHLQNNKLF